jgi:hypothetical protein
MVFEVPARTNQNAEIIQWFQRRRKKNAPTAVKILL